MAFTSFKMESFNIIKPLLAETYSFPKKGKLLRKDAARLLRSLIANEEDDENNEPYPNTYPNLDKTVPMKRNVARRGKPLRLGLRAQRLIDNETRKENSESITELILDRNFCRFLMRQKRVSSDVHLFLEGRLAYINYKLNKVI